MNPSPIRTPIDREIDRWFFNVHLGDGKHVVEFQIVMHRSRDIEATPMKWNFTAHSVALEDATKKQYVTSSRLSRWRMEASDLERLRKDIQEYIRALEMTPGEWEKVVVVYAKYIGGEPYVGSRPIEFDYGIGFRSKDRQWFRGGSRHKENFIDRHPGHMLRHVYADGVTVHEWSQDLEDSLKMLDDKFQQFGNALEQLVKSPEQLVVQAGNGAKLLGAG